MNGSGSLLIDLQTLIVAVALVIPRAITCLSFLPTSGFRNLQGFAKNAAAIAITLPAVLPTFQFIQRTPLDYVSGGILIAKEVAFGGMLGILLAIPVWVVQSIGAIFDQQRSAVQTQSTDSTLQDTSALGMLMTQGIGIVMIEAGLFVALFRILIESYAVWPAFSMLPPFEHGHFDEVIKRLGSFFWYVTVYGAPLLIPLVMVEFSFAMIGVFASNLQVSSMSAPIKALLGLFIMLVYWSTFAHYVAGDFSHMLDLAATLVDATARPVMP